MKQFKKAFGVSVLMMLTDLQESDHSDRRFCFSILETPRRINK